jgi:hypothetical protein
VSEKPVKKEWNVPHEKKKVLSEKYNIAMQQNQIPAEAV